MCYDISFTVHVNELRDYFPDLVFDNQLSIDFDGAIGAHIIGHAYGDHPVIYRHQQDQQLHCRPMEWGCIPFYVKEEKAFARQRTTMLNARSERILEDKSSYWYKIRNRRCLVPVNGIYEHRAIKGWKKKVPYFIQLKEQPMFFLPGLYSVVELPDTSTGELLQRWTYTIITRKANALMEQIHNDGENRGRMPLFLSFELANQWLSADLNEADYRSILDFEMPAEALDYWPVYTIRSAKERPDKQLKMMPWEWEQLPALGEANPD
ncbi:MAG TPA: SOS response-associated peptidase family protein [Chitinophagaceae bacterium]|nr:SOS response-associated peptidase family protein [Chitinophagaceae bacterium]